MTAPWDEDYQPKLESGTIPAPSNDPKLQQSFGKGCYVVSDKPTSGRPVGNLDPNYDNADPEKIFLYQEQVAKISNELSDIENAMFEIIDKYSESKSAVRLELVRNFAEAQDGTKKTAGIEILELYAVSKKEELKLAYKDYILYETKKDMLSKIMESKKSRMSGIQSNMKYDNWRQG